MFRKGVSLTLCISFIILLASSIVLYIVPEGRVAYWSNWTCLTLSKQQWGDIHITGGFLFLAACIAHILINLRALVSYLKIRSREKWIPFAGSLMLCIFVFGGTLAGWHPMSDILALSSSMKKEQERIHGNPPYGHAEASRLEDFCRFMRMDLEHVVSGLTGRGLKGTISGSSTLRDMATANGISPAGLYTIILDVTGVSEEQALRLAKPSGKRKNSPRF